MRFLRAAGAFLRKDFLEESSYRLNFLLGFAGVLVLLVFVRFLSQFVGPVEVDGAGGYRGDYFAFVVVGIGAQAFLSAALQELASRIRRAQVLGTLEALLGTCTPLPTLVVCLPLYAFVQTALRVSLALCVGVLAFDMRIHWESALPALAAALLTLAAFGSLGSIVAGLTIAFKRTEPLVTLLSGASLLLGGVYYPVEALYGWLRPVAALVPTSHALEGLRVTLLAGGGWAEVAPALARLALFVAVVGPLSVSVFRLCLRRAMRDGTLTQY